jgi:hypothetical protein
MIFEKRKLVLVDDALQLQKNKKDLENLKIQKKETNRVNYLKFRLNLTM